MYECHITILGDPTKIEDVLKDTNWHFSKIDGDPYLGSGVKCYATNNYSKDEYALSDCLLEMNTIVAYLKGQKLEVIRMKVEDILYDKRF